MRLWPTRPPPRPHPQPGESLVLYLDPTSTLVLTPGCCGPETHFQTSVVVDGSLAVEFRTGNNTDHKGAC
jgi:hypothetical protein